MSSRRLRVHRRVWPLSPAGRLRVGVLSDTHGLLRPSVRHCLRGVHLILHAGDVGRPSILRDLEGLAPVFAVRGNTDGDPQLQALPDLLEIALGNWQVTLVHDLQDLPPGDGPRRPDAVISGHSHRPLIDWRQDTLYLNPGSAGPRRFRLPVSLGFLHVGVDGLEAVTRTLSE